MSNIAGDIRFQQKESPVIIEVDDLTSSKSSEDNTKSHSFSSSQITKSEVPVSNLKINHNMYKASLLKQAKPEKIEKEEEIIDDKERKEEEAKLSENVEKANTNISPFIKNNEKELNKKQSLVLNNTIFSRGIPFPNSNDINPLIRSKLKDDLKGMHQYCNAKDRRPFKGIHVKVRIKSIALCFTQVIKQLIL